MRMGEGAHLPSQLSIGQFNDGYYPVTDGVATCAYNYAYWLNRKYGTCRLYVPVAPDTQFHDPFEVVGYRSVPLKGRPPYRVGMPQLDRAYRKEVDQTRFDLVHTHSPFSSGSEALRIGRRQRIPVVATFHSKFYDDFYEYTKSKAISKAGIEYVIHKFNRMDSVWTVSEGTLETLREYGYKGDVTVMPNGTDLEPLQHVASARMQAEQFCGIGPEETMFLFVGQHIWQKNIRLTAQAIQKLSRDRGQFRLIMVGDGVARRELEQWVQENHLGDVIRFMGQVHDRNLLRALYARADLFVFPSLYDNAPLVVREAAAMGTPTVTVRGCNAAQGFVHMDNGLLCENDVDSLCEQLAFAMDHPAQLAQIGLRAQQTLARSWESIIDEVYEKYLVIIDKYRHAHRDEA